MNTTTNKQCQVCEKRFPTVRGLHIHRSRLSHWSHPALFIHPTPTIKKEELYDFSEQPSLTGLGCKDLKPGDKIELTYIFIIKKITKNSSSDSVDVEVLKAKGSWRSLEL